MATNDQQPAPNLSAVIGQRMRALREAAGDRQADVAKRARLHGLDWTQPTVAAIEMGRRAVAIEELLVLPILFGGPNYDDFTGRELVDFMPPDGSYVALGKGAAVSARFLRSVARGETERVRVDDFPAVFKNMKFDFEPIVRMEKFILAGWPELAEMKAEEAEYARPRDFRDDTVVNAARRLDVDPLDVSVGARLLWHRPFAEERDRRAIEAADHDAPPRTIQALRGHVTRELLAELEPEIRKAEARREAKG